MTINHIFNASSCWGLMWYNMKMKKYDFFCFELQNKYIMEESSKAILSNKQAQIVQRYRQRIKQIEEQQICNRIVHRDTNNLDFYKITPKQELPKFLQKMHFQTLHLKQKDIAASIKVFKKQNRKPVQAQLRQKLKEQGHLMLLSEIYQNLGEQGDLPKHTSTQPDHDLIEQPNQLDQWEKLHQNDRSQPIQNRGRESKECSVKGIRQGYDYRGEVERGLQIIEVTHGSQSNLLNRYMLIENSSKLLKKELDDKKGQVQENIKSRMKLLYEARTEYHACFEERNRLRLEERLLREEPKEDILKMSHKSLTGKSQKGQKRSMFQANQARISRTKKTIEGLQEAIASLEQQLRKILQAQKVYYKTSLRNGTDVRECGLVWVIRRLQMQQSDIVHFQFPAYLDRRSRQFLILKAKSQQQQEFLLEEKRRFVNEIGKANSQSKFKYHYMISPSKQPSGDRIVETQFRPDNNIPKKYRRSQRKMSALAEQFLKNSSLLDLRGGARNVEISADLQGLSHKEIYEQVGARIKRLDLSKIRREKLGSKGARLMEYQSLLEKIKKADIQLEEMDLQHENYLLAHLRDNRNLFFMQAAACFGYKRAYSMIIKHFSWKNYNDQHLPKVSNN